MTKILVHIDYINEVKGTFEFEYNYNGSFQEFLNETQRQATINGKYTFDSIVVDRKEIKSIWYKEKK